MSLLTRLLGRAFGGGLRRQVDECLAMIRMGIALRLVSKYRPLYGDEKASATASGSFTIALAKISGIPPQI